MGVEEILDEVLRSEGGYQDHPEDHGNYYKGQNLGTNYGITPRTLARYRGKDVTREDMLNLTEEEAREVYREEYVSPVLGQLAPPREIVPQLVDMSINHGFRNAVRLYQRALWVREDGVPGPTTRMAGFMWDPIVLNDALVDIRKDFYRSIVKRLPEKKKYINGWLKRAEKYRMDYGQGTN